MSFCGELPSVLPSLITASTGLASGLFPWFPGIFVAIGPSLGRSKKMQGAGVEENRGGGDVIRKYVSLPKVPLHCTCDHYHHYSYNYQSRNKPPFLQHAYLLRFFLLLRDSLLFNGGCLFC